MNQIKKAKAYLKRYGTKKLIWKVLEKQDKTEDYENNRIEEMVTESEMEQQRNAVFKNKVTISIVVPIYNTDPEKLIQTLYSVKQQTYSDWQLCIADAGEEKRKSVIDSVFGDDSRIKYISLKENFGISDNTNSALELATGEYVGFLDHDDILEPDALYEIMKKIDKGYEMIYTDEDKVSEGLDYYFAPYRKPDFNLNLLLSNNYICHFTVIKKSILDKMVGFRKEFDGAQDYDLFLRCIEKTDKIAHVPKILYHWRVGEDSTSSNPFAKEYAYEAGRRALEDYIDRNNIKGVRVEEMDDPGYYRIVCFKKGGYKVCTVVSHEITEPLCTHYLLLDSKMKINRGDIDRLLKRAYFTKADVVVPKIIKKGKYVYNGLAKTGKGHTPSLAGKPYWFKGKFNLGECNMDIQVAPSSGILIKRELYDESFKGKAFHINSMKGKYKGIKMVYAPEAAIYK